MSDVYEIATPTGYVRYVPESRHLSEIAALEARLAEAETHRDKNRETAISSQQWVNQLEARCVQLEDNLRIAVKVGLDDLRTFVGEHKALEARCMQRDKLVEALRNLLARVDDQFGSGDEYDWKEQTEARELLHSCAREG